MNAAGAPPAGPLAGIKVLDLSRFIAGPFCAMMLGDMGADVAKVEKPGGGEPARQAPPLHGGASLFAAAFNRNKRSVALDLRGAAGREILRALAAEADVLIENFRPGVMEDMGCGWPVLREANPRLTMARISGYGQDGPLARRPAFDAVAQALSGLMTMTGAADGPPTLAGATPVDHVAGLHTLAAVLAALHARNASGEGQRVEVSLIDSARSLLGIALPAAAAGAAPLRRGNRDAYGAPGNAFPCADGAPVYIVAGGAERFARLAEAIGRADLTRDPRFADDASRLANAAALEAEIAAWTRRRTAAEVCERLAGARIPAGKVSALGEAGAPGSERTMEIEHPGGRIAAPGFAAQFSATPQALARGVPAPGAHTAEVLADWLAWDAARLEAFGARGAFAPAAGSA